jgi:hypothetical protein
MSHSKETLLAIWNAGFDACAEEYRKQRENPDYPITRTEPGFINDDGTEAFKPFTIDDLFRIEYPRDNDLYTTDCLECGCIVKTLDGTLQNHVKWHNKVADL